MRSERALTCSEFMGQAWRLQWDKQVGLGARVGLAGLEEARKRFHNQDERFHDTDRGVPVRTTWAIGPTPNSTTPRQLSALWNWSGGVGTPWKVIPLRVLPIKEGRGVGQTWLLGAERPPPALELTLPSGKVFVRAEMTEPRRARTDVWDKIKQQRGQPQAEAVEVDPWLNKMASGATPAGQKNPWQGWRGTAASDRREEMQVQQEPTSEHHGDGVQEVQGNEARDAGRSRNDAGTKREENLREQRPKMRTLQEAMANQQVKMSKVEDVITTSAASAADQRKTQEMVERMMRMVKEKEKRKKPDTDVELEDDPS